MSDLTAGRKLIVFGKMSKMMKNGLLSRYRVDILYQFEGKKEALQGKNLVMVGEYDSILFAESISHELRNFIIAQLEKRDDFSDLTIVALTDEQSYSTWLPLSPRASTDEIAQRFGLEQQGKPAQIIVVANTKGGVGKSHVASNLATMLAEMGKNVVILEDDWTTRSVKDLMGVADTNKMSANLVSDINAQDGVVSPELLQSYLVKSFGVNCLIGPPTILTSFNVTPEIAREIIAVMGFELSVDYIVIDAPPDFLNTSSFTLSVLSNSQNSPTPPIIIVPVVPETTILRSAEDTLVVATSMEHPKERIWPIVNCIKGEHNPDSLRGGKVLWAPPTVIIPYCPDAQFVGDRHRPMVAEKPGGALAKFWKSKVLGMADIYHIREAYKSLSTSVIEFTENGEHPSG